MGDYKPEIVYERAGIAGSRSARRCGDCAIECKRVVRSWSRLRDDVDLPVISAFRLLAAKLQSRHPILLKDIFVKDQENPAVGFSSHIADCIDEHRLAALRWNRRCDSGARRGGARASVAPFLQILQAAGTRIFKTDYVACPSCGRTLFNLQTTTARIKAATLHLKGVKIAIMGCIVNGPGEMADADFGYVGGAPGKVNLYVGKTAVKFNIPEAEAVERLQDLIREHGKWVEPAG